MATMLIGPALGGVRGSSNRQRAGRPAGETLKQFIRASARGSLKPHVRASAKGSVREKALGKRGAPRQSLVNRATRGARPTRAARRTAVPSTNRAPARDLAAEAAARRAQSEADAAAKRQAENDRIQREVNARAKSFSIETSTARPPSAGDPAPDVTASGSGGPQPSQVSSTTGTRRPSQRRVRRGSGGGRRSLVATNRGLLGLDDLLGT